MSGFDTKPQAIAYLKGLTLEAWADRAATWQQLVARQPALADCEQQFLQGCEASKDVQPGERILASLALRDAELSG